MKYEKKIIDSEKKKIDWSVVKDKCLNAVKVSIFTLIMLAGFWAVYVVLWNALGFPCTTPAAWLLFLQAIVSESFFIKWCIK